MSARSTGSATAATDPVVDHDHVQGNILRGYRLGDVRYFTLAFTNAAGGRSLLNTLITGTPEIPAVETASEWSVRPSACLNVGLTYDGVCALGLPDATLAAFPDAFKSGSAQRSKESVDEPEMWRGVGLGDIDDSAPEHWIMGGPNNGTVHLVVSVFTDEATTPRRNDVTVALRAAFAADGVTELSTHDGHTFPHGDIHFGYRDGISQPQVTGRPGPRKKDMQPWTRTGDFLLGRGYKNIYGGNFLGDLPPAIGDNGTYMVFRILRQDVQAFHDFTVRTGARFDMDPELVAAKMLGRWPNGVPLAISPDDPDVRIKPKNLNRFDHAATVNHPTNFDDADGLRCPFGAHMRRMNPRGGPVIGIQHNHRIIRRGVPYGPEFDPKKPDDIERGLLGAFFCGDLANQFEFLMKVWCNLDFSAPMLRGTRDPIIGYQPPGGGRFTLPTRDTRGVEVTHDLPRLVHTRGSLYLFVPGIGGLRTLAQGSG